MAQQWTAIKHLAQPNMEIIFTKKMIKTESKFMINWNPTSIEPDTLRETICYEQYSTQGADRPSALC